MSVEVVYTSGSQTLAEFQKVAQQQEGIFGPLKQLGVQGDKNALTLEIGPAPQNRVELETYAGPQPPDKAGYARICNALCLVDGKSTATAAYRKNP